MRTARAESLRRRDVLPLLAWVGLVVSFLFVLPARADEIKAEGRFVPVPGNLTEGAVNRILDSVNEEIDRFIKPNTKLDIAQRRVFKVVFDFNPEGKAASSDKFEECLKLAKGIRDLSFRSKDGGKTREKLPVETLAFVHGEVSRHTVLPVLACEKVVMSRKAVVGPVLGDGIKELPKYVKETYTGLAFRLSGTDVLEKLLDHGLGIAPSRNGGWVSTLKDKEVAPGRHLFEVGEKAVFNHEKALKVNLCEPNPLEDRQEIVAEYRLSESSLRENPILRGVVAAKITVSGEVNKALEERLKRRISRAMGQKANLIILELRCRRGDVAVANSIAEYLIEFSKNPDRQDRPVEFIAYLTPDAQDTALYLAMGCHSIVMDPMATLGGFGTLLKDKSDSELKAIGDGMEKLAEQREYRPALARALVDPGVLRLFLVRDLKSGQTNFLTAQQLDDEKQKERDQQRWGNQVEILVDKTGLITEDSNNPANLSIGARWKADQIMPVLSAVEADKHGLAYLKGNFDDIKTRKGLKGEEVIVIGDDWLDDLAEFLRNEWVRFLLVMIGITCLMLELKMPGVGLPGIIAALCFVLFFWSGAKMMGQQIAWLAVLLFLLGLVLLGLEIFVLPGFGVCGISGILLVLGSLALVAYGRWPQDGAEWVGLSKKVAPFGLSLMGAVVLAIILARYLPSIPYVNRLLLHPPVNEDGQDGDGEGPRSAFAALLGAIGVAATPLRPAGKVQFDDQYVDVVAEGSYIVPGTRVQVIEVEGNRVVVKAV